MKAEGILGQRRVGAYRVWYIREIAEETKKILPKRIISSLGRAFLKVFGDNAYEIAKKVGYAIIDEVYDLLTFEEPPSEENIFSTVAELVSMISEGISAEGIKLREGRGIFRVVVEDHFLDPDIIKLIAHLFSGTIAGIFEKILSRKILVLDPIISNKNSSFEIIVEVKL